MTATTFTPTIKKTSGITKAKPLDNFILTGSTPESQATNLVKDILQTKGLTSIDQIYELTNQYLQKPRNEIHEIVKNLGIEVQLEKYVLKTIGNPKIDSFRLIACDIFSKSSSVRKQDVVEVWKREAGEEPSPQVYSKVMNEFATFSGGLWKVK